MEWSTRLGLAASLLAGRTATSNIRQSLKERNFAGEKENRNSYKLELKTSCD